VALPSLGGRRTEFTERERAELDLLLSLWWHPIAAIAWTMHGCKGPGAVIIDGNDAARAMRLARANAGTASWVKSFRFSAGFATAPELELFEEAQARVAEYDPEASVVVGVAYPTADPDERDFVFTTVTDCTPAPPEALRTLKLGLFHLEPQAPPKTWKVRRPDADACLA
jgi:hypothetical protein